MNNVEQHTATSWESHSHNYLFYFGMSNSFKKANEGKSLYYSLK